MSDKDKPSGTSAHGDHTMAGKTKICGVLDQLREDIVHTPPCSSGFTSPVNNYHGVNEGSSKTDFSEGNIFIQQSNGRFKSAPKDTMTPMNCEEELPKCSTAYTPLDVAIFMQMFWSRFGFICLGLLAGCGVFHLFSIDMLWKGWDYEDIIEFYTFYSPLANALPICFYVLGTISLISLLDWFDMGHMNLKHLADMLSHRPSCLVILLSLAMLTISLSSVYHDEFIYMFSDLRPQFNETHHVELLEGLQHWLTLDHLRCVLALLIWLAVAFTYPVDLFRLHLCAIKKYEGVAQGQAVSSTTNVQY